MAHHVTASFEHEGHRLVYEEHGTGDRLLVYLHALLLDAEVNRGIAEALAATGNRVILLDLLGHGRSDQPTHASDHRIDSYSEQVIALLDHLGVDDAALGGISLGANVSLYTAAHHPERVRAMVLEMPVMEWAVPAAATEKVAVVPSHAEAGTGWVVMVTGRRTVSRAAVLVALPQVLVAMQTYSPASASEAAAMANDGPVAPGMIAPLRFHAKVGAGAPVTETANCTD